MQTATVLIALGGDRNNTVPKQVTAAEIPVLMAIHGGDAVFDIEPGDDADVSPHEELDRLSATYRAKNDDNQPIVSTVYAGRGAPMPQTLEDLRLPDDLYKATSRAKPSAAEKPKRQKAPASKPKAPTTEEPASTNVME